MADNDEIFLTVDGSVYTDTSTVSIIDPHITLTGDLSIDGSTNVSTISTSPYYTTHSSFSYPSDQTILIGNQDEEKKKIYICEKWQSKKPIDLGDGLFASFPEDMLSGSELKQKVYNRIEELHPDKAIKLGLNEENITLRKKSVTIEIDIEGS
jgi:hypothetical protein